MATASKFLERVTARVFCHGPGGGNPVTVFSSRFPLSTSLQQRLAKSCDWESVMVQLAAPPAATKAVTEMAFYMPSGEAVSFCAHAALGGAFAASTTTDFVFRSATMTDNIEHRVQISKSEETDGNERGGSARLLMFATFEETPVSYPPSLYRLLRSHLGVAPEALVRRVGRQYPSILNASIVRPKTLVYVNSEDDVHKARQPVADLDPSSSQIRNTFAAACKGIDDSTGIYLYSKKKDQENAWECRQFPRASGYPEDPATGIAAAALAGSLYKQGIYLPIYKFYQGTAMQRPSLIEVSDVNIVGNDAKFTLQGRIEIDSRETIVIEDEDLV